MGAGELQGIVVVGDGYMHVESFLNLYNYNALLQIKKLN